MSYAYKLAGEWIEITGPFTLGAGDEALHYPYNWPDLATQEERDAVGIKEVTETDPPTGVAIDYAYLADVDDAPVRAWATHEYTFEEAHGIAYGNLFAFRQNYSFIICPLCQAAGSAVESAIAAATTAAEVLAIDIQAVFEANLPH